MNVYTVQCGGVVCTKCGIDKPLSSFSTNGTGLYKKRCKPCRSADQSARYAAKPIEQRRAEMQRISEWVRRNPDKYREYARKTRKAKPDHYRLKVQLRRRRYRAATPSWADRAAIAAIYRRAAEMTATTGVPHEVDHIVPLTSTMVCGLHCEANLQVLPMLENKRKNNLIWPDMP